MINSQNGSNLSRRKMLQSMGLGIGAMAMASTPYAKMAFGKSERTSREGQPNIIFIMSDDQGYYDMNCYGNNQLNTPNWNKMADEGIRFTSYTATMVCSPTRASFMTGCYHERVGFSWILTLNSDGALNTNEQNVARMLQSAGYATGCVGKWHLGHGGMAQTGCKGAMVKDYGYDYYWGILGGIGAHLEGPGQEGIRVVLEQNESMSNDQVDIRNVDYNTPEGKKELDDLPINETNKAIDFIKRHKDGPFFLYLSYSAPHVPVFAPEQFAGKSNYRGSYGDVIESLDWGTGQILQTLKDQGIDENTLVIYCSDNGAPSNESNAPLSGTKWGVDEGSYRVPCIARWPGNIPSGKVSDEMISVMDWLPTFAAIGGAEDYLPTFTYDGKDQSAHLMDPSTPSARDELVYWKNKRLEAVRKGDYKLRFSRGDANAGLDRGEPYKLYNVKTDSQEAIDLFNDQSLKSTIDEITALRDQWAAKLGDSITSVGGRERRSGMKCG